MKHTAHTDLHSMREHGAGASLNNAKTLPDLKQSFLLRSVHVITHRQAFCNALNTL